MLALLVGTGSRAQAQTPPPAAPEPRSSVQWQLMVGGLASLDGYTSAGYQGLVLAAGWEFPSWRLRFQFLAGQPNTLVDERTEVQFGQYTFGLWLDTPLLQSPGWRWAVGAGAGLHVFSRSTFPLFRGVRPEDPRLIPALLTGPETSLRWRFARRFAVEGTASVDVVVGRPILGYVTNNGFEPLHRGWPVRPRLAVSFLVLP
ncbi:hypothetical protein [Pyxidicoccus fallax]|nr:hypothetical protein [Pyxidicoccus fallax]